LRHRREFTMRIHTLRRRFDRNRRRLDVSTQTVREALIVDLEATFELAQERLHAVQKEQHKQYWARVMAYIAQTLAFISKEYDLSKINHKLKEFDQRFQKLQKKLQKKTGPGS